MILRRGLKSSRNYGELIFTFETAMHRAMQEKQYSEVAINAKVLMKLVGLETKVKS